MIKIAFIGAGKMATALIEGLLRNGIVSPDEIGCICGDDSTGKDLAKRINIHHKESPEELFEKDQYVIVACKPQQLDDLPPELADWTEDSLVISILAGTQIARLSEKFPKARNVIRAMPNTPGQIGAGVTAFSPKDELTDSDLMFTESFFSCLGVFMELPESDIDAVTAVSGSGPAYVFEFLIAFRNAAVAAGLQENVAMTLARETVYGAAKLLETSWLRPEDLRDSVTSKGGTTEAALKELNKGDTNLHTIIKDAVLAAKVRAEELSKM